MLKWTSCFLLFALAMVKVILPEKRSYKKTFTINSWKQNGLCLLCRRGISFGEVIVSNSNKNTKYYHEGCAKRVAILP